MIISLEGMWKAELADGNMGQMRLPGTLDENGIGQKDCGANQWHPDATLGNADGAVDKDAPIATRFTRRHTYEGEARISRKIDIPDYGNERLFVRAERARALRLCVDGVKCTVFRQGTLSTPYIFELTGVEPGEHELTFLSDNSYPGMPKSDICYSSAATDETQTNWNGIVGELVMYTKPQEFIAGLRVYPRKEESAAGGFVLDVCVEIAAGDEWASAADVCQREWKAVLCSNALAEGKAEVFFTSVELAAVRNKENSETKLLNITSGNNGLPGGITARSKINCGEAVVGHGNKCCEKERIEFRFTDLKLRDDVKLWDEEAGKLYEMTAMLSVQVEELQSEDAQPGNLQPEKLHTTCDKYSTHFGIRYFGDNGTGRLALNGRTIFLRSEANCAEYPETGHPPMTVREWKEILLKYRSYGINCVRFHSHCEPEAAFIAADEVGMLLQPELSNWNPKDAFETEESYVYYREELTAVLREYANHPSFVMLTLGNELHALSNGRARMKELVRLAKSLDPTRLYANGSNAFYGEEGCDPESDFYTSQSCKEVVIRGTFSGMKGYINEQYPSAEHTYDEAMTVIRQQYGKPVFSFEVGQFEVLPDFEELNSFHGILDPVNLKLIKKRVEEQELLPVWKQYVAATGELSRLAYREEIEAAMRTKELSGISLLGLQDFPGQGTALVGMMNSHLEPKPYAFAKPERFREFFRESRVLVKLPRYTYEVGEVLTAEVEVANFGKENIEGELHWSISYRECATNSGVGEIRSDTCKQDGIYQMQKDAESPENKKYRATVESMGTKSSDTESAGTKKADYRKICPLGTYTCVGSLKIPLNFIIASAALTLTVSIGNCTSTYPVWVYEKTLPVCPENVYETRNFDEKTIEVLKNGGNVYLSPDADEEHLPHSIKTQFTTDFWSVGTFADQEGGMGQLIDVTHPIFREFPTDFHTDWQWWIMATKRAVILPRPMKAIITEMDSYAYLRPMAQLLEFNCLKGKVLLSTMELHKSLQYPEARALQTAIYEYMEGKEFVPEEKLTPEEISAFSAGMIKDDRNRNCAN